MSKRNALRKIGEQVYITGETIGIHKTDNEGRQIWWFGSDPPEGVPSPGAFIKSLQARRLHKIGPPWAAVAVGMKEEGIWVCTDALGSQHLFLRKVGKDILVGPDVFKLAAHAPVYLDPIGAYELFCLQNPQGGRTLFSDVRLIPPATQIRLDNTYRSDTYWSLPPPSPSDPEHAIKTFIEVLINSVSKNWRPGCVLELTGGEDSMLNLAAYRKAGMPVETWTHGFEEDFDMVAARARAKSLGVPHRPVFTEPLENLSPSEAGSLAIEFLNASGGQANILECWCLPWILEKLNASCSISGNGGEIFRGAYYRFTGRGFLPKLLTELALFHIDVRHSMPWAAPFLDKRFKQMGEAAVSSDFRKVLQYRESSYHGLDAYYVNRRMHHFVGTTWSATGRWCPVRAPFCDPDLIDCLSLIPIELRDRSRLTREATRRLLGSQLQVSMPHLRKKSRITRLCRKVRNAKGEFLEGSYDSAAGLLLNSPQAKSALEVDTMRTGSFYNRSVLTRYIEKTMAGEQAISLPLGALLTIELSARAVGDAFKGADF